MSIVAGYQCIVNKNYSNGCRAMFQKIKLQSIDYCYIFLVKTLIFI